VAQLVLTFVLSFSVSLVQSARALAAAGPPHFAAPPALPLFELPGRTLGLVGGGGAIGSRVATLARGLGMTVLVWGRTPGSSPDWVPLPELLRRSDFLSLHCPLTPDTRHLINASTLAQMKPTAYLINTSRGGVVDEAALVAALRSGALAGAALDVQDPEPPTETSPLWDCPGVVLTPHLGWKRVETRQRLVGAVAQNVAAFAGGALVNVVTPRPGK
jgi:glycerate dehydrogenase